MLIKETLGSFILDRVQMSWI